MYVLKYMGFNFKKVSREKNEVVLMILNMENSSLDNQNNKSKYSPIVGYLIQYVERDNYMMMQHHMLLNVYVIFFGNI